jgi:hypothetical protein
MPELLVFGSNGSKPTGLNPPPFAIGVPPEGLVNH